MTKTKMDRRNQNALRSAWRRVGVVATAVLALGATACSRPTITTTPNQPSVPFGPSVNAPQVPGGAREFCDNTVQKTYVDVGLGTGSGELFFGQRCAIDRLFNGMGAITNSDRTCAVAFQAQSGPGSRFGSTIWFNGSPASFQRPARGGQVALTSTPLTDSYQIEASVNGELFATSVEVSRRPPVLHDNDVMTIGRIACLQPPTQNP